MDKPKTRDGNRELALINAGFGRSGTTSLKAALEHLGFAPCYKMEDMVKRPGHMAVWEAAARGEPVDWSQILGEYRSILEPSAHFYRQLMAAFPNAKVILTTRNPERWYDSMQQTIYWRRNLLHSPAGAAALVFLPRLRRVRDLSEQVLWQGLFAGRFDDRAWAIDRYGRHLQDVMATVPPDRLLVYDVKDGWAPLCAFLGVPVPSDEPFPHVNSTRWLRQRVRRRALGLGFLLVVVGLLARTRLRRRHTPSA